MRQLLFCCLFSITFSAFSQQKFSKEFSFINDNDLYVSIEKDQYYTNGMFLTYRTLAKDFGKLEKKIYEFEIGHEIYTPYRPDVSNVIAHDRPFAGYLFGSFGISRVYKTNTIFKSKVQLGILGEDSLGEGLQNFIHDIYGFKMPIGWKYQIRNTLALNVDLEYIKGLVKTYEYNDFNFISKLRIGTIFNEITAGFMGRIGFKKIPKMSNTIAFNTHLNDSKTSTSREIESFLFYTAMVTYVAYDATIEGSLFNNNSPVTYNPNSVRIDLGLGYRFTANKWTLGYEYRFHTNKLPNLRNDNGNVYGRLIFSYLFN